MSDIVVDPSGISRYSRGKFRNKIAWSEVSRIRFAPMPVRNPATLVYVVETINNPHPRWPGYGGINLTNAIQDARALLDLMNHYVRQYNIPVIDTRSGSEVRIGTVPLA
jgi:hypothetical protein